MNWWLVFEIVLNLYQSGLMLYFMKKRLRATNPSAAADIACFTGMASFYTLYLFFDIPLLDTVVFVIPLVYGWIVSNDKWYVVLFWTMVLALIFSGGANIAISFYTGVLGVGWDQIMSATPYRLAFVISGNLLLLIMVLLAVRIPKRGEHPAWPAFIPLVLLNCLCLAAIECLFLMNERNDLGRYFTYACLCLFAISILSIVFFEVMAYYAKKQRQYQTEIERLEMTKKYNLEMQDVYRQSAIFRHDFKQQLQTLSGMIGASGNEEAERYLGVLSREVDALKPFSTGNIAVDALLTAKYTSMRRLGIALDFKPYPLNELPIAESEFCVLLGNLLDNAIEGICRMKEPSKSSVSLSVARTWDMLYITCQNPCDAKTLRPSRGSFLSSKPGANHGIGLASVEATVKTARGHIRIAPCDGVFRVEVVLPYAVHTNE